MPAMTTLDMFYTADEIARRGLSHKKAVTIRMQARKNGIGVVKAGVRLFTVEDIARINAIKHVGRRANPNAKYHNWRKRYPNRTHSHEAGAEASILPEAKG